MSKKPRNSKRRGASIGIAVCFAAAVALVGTYTLGNFQEKARREAQKAEETEDADKNREPAASANTDKLVIDTEDKAEETAIPEKTEEKTEEEKAGENLGAASVSSVENMTVNFTENSTIQWPVNGQVLMGFSMDKTTYFATLDQYKYNPAVIIGGAEGDQVISGAPGVVKSIDVTAQTGTTVNLDLGGGYELFIGQLKEVPLSVGEYVAADTIVGYVSQPTKYYSLEGSNVYYEMRKDGNPIDPLQFVGE